MIFLFALLIGGHQLLLLMKRRRFDPLDVKVLIDIVLLVMWVFAPLMDPMLRFRLNNDLLFAFTTFFGIIFLYIGLHLPVWRCFPTPRWLSDAPILRTRWLWLSLFVFMVATLMLAFQNAQYSGGGILGLFTEDRLGALVEKLNEGNEGSILSRLIGVSHVILLMWLAVSLINRRWKQATALYLILLVGILLITVVRLPIIITLLIPFAYYYRGRNRSMSIRSASLIGIVFLILMFFLNIWRGQGIDAVFAIDFSFSRVINSLVRDLSPLQGYEILWQLAKENRLPYEYGLSYLYIPLTAVPRTLWAAKPLVSFAPRWTTFLFGQHYAFTSLGWGVWTFTVWGEGLAQFGKLGVFLNMFLYGLLVAWADSRFGRNPKFVLVWFYYSIISATFLRSSFSSLAWAYLQAFLPLMLVYYLSVRRKTKTFVIRRPSPGDQLPTSTYAHEFEIEETV